VEGMVIHIKVVEEGGCLIKIHRVWEEEVVLV